MTIISRRQMLGAAGAAAFLPSVAGASGQPAPGYGARTNLTPDQALAALREGNRRYVSDRPAQGPVSRRRRLEIAATQTPFATLVSCSDSRVGPEQLFGRGLGELFIVRNAGNTVSSNQALGSVEFSVAVLGVPLIVVLGHQRCGAVAAATQIVERNATFPASIGRMVEPIVPAALAARGQAGDYVENSGHMNVRRTVEQLRTSVEPALLDPQRQGRLRVVGAYYSLDSGAVDFFDVG